MPELILASLIGLLLGGTICYFMMKKKLDISRNDFQNLQKDFLKTEATLETTKEKLDDQKEYMMQMQEKFKAEFHKLAQDVLDEKTQKFTDINQKNMKHILDPLKEDIGIFKKKVEETYDKESKERFTLEREVKRLIDMTHQVSQEANNLSSALKSNNKIQGNWGEMILESILENSGLGKNREYFLQEFIRDNSGNVIKDENGRGLQPDAIVVYPDKRKVIIDSKVSLIAWEKYINESQTEEQPSFLSEHIKSIRNHVDGLSKKNYPRYAAALDYVLMFIPIEAAFLQALNADTALWKYAYDKNILLVSPTNLFAVLKIVGELWRVEKQNQNAIEIADKAGSLYDKFVGFLDNFDELGKKIDEAKNAYDRSYNQLSTGKGNLVRQTENLKKMGANARKQISDKHLSEGAEN